MASIENSEGGMPKHSGIADLIVKGAIALVTAAFFVGAYLQFQVSFWMALIGALSVYITLLMGHAVMRRRERETDLVSEVTRLEDEVARLKTGASPPPPGASRALRAWRRHRSPRHRRLHRCRRSHRKSRRRQLRLRLHRRHFRLTLRGPRASSVPRRERLLRRPSARRA
jgi:hypothetical protein